MEFFYVDPGLRTDLGHHANSCRLITRELRARGIASRVFAHQSIDPALQSELAAVPHLRWWTYASVDLDPISGWLTAFLRVATETAQDLARLPPVAAGDVVFFNSVQPAQLMALLEWMRSFPPGRIPHVMAEFGTGPGLDYDVVPEGLRVRTRDPRQDPRAVLYRFSAGLMAGLDLTRLHLFTFEAMSSQLYSYLLKTPVQVLPLPHVATGPLADRAKRRPLTIAVLGHQRPEKGFALVPEIAERLLAQRPDIRMLVHNGAPDNMVPQQQALRALALTHKQLELDERVAGPELWQALLQRSDIILCPYPVWNFAAAYSAVAAEAVAAGIPLVVPAGTTLSVLLGQYGGGGTTFAQHEPGSIVAAVIQAVERFDELLEMATRASKEWHKTMGAQKMVEGLLAMALPAHESAKSERTNPP
jgi:glycosyltransferase involved in cell wall biosynthesis